MKKNNVISNNDLVNDGLVKNGLVNDSLVDSLFAFHGAENQEIFDYISEHLYIQSQLAIPRIQQLGNFSGMKSFHRSCQKLYCASDDRSKSEAMDEIKMQMA